MSRRERKRERERGNEERNRESLLEKERRMKGCRGRGGFVKFIIGTLHSSCCHLLMKDVQ